MRKIVLLSALVMLVAFPVFAASLPNYVVLKAGGYFPQDDDLDEFDNAFYGEVGIGHYVHPNIALEFGVGYTESSASESVPGLGSVDADLTIIPIMLGVRLLTSAGNIEPYATAGIGMYYTELDASVSLPGVGTGSASDDDTAFGGYLGLGANYDITPNVFLGVEAKYFMASPSFEGEDVDIDGITATANLGFRF